MPLTISDKALQQAGLTEWDALIQFACHLFDAGKLHLWPAAKMAGLTRIEMEEQLAQRKIPIYRPTVEDINHDVETLTRLGY
jgi:predicted HTH domain antitoxin